MAVMKTWGTEQKSVVVQGHPTTLDDLERLAHSFTPNMPISEPHGKFE